MGEFEYRSTAEKVIDKFGNNPWEETWTIREQVMNSIDVDLILGDLEDIGIKVNPTT